MTAKSAARKRGRPRRDAKSGQGGIIEQVRNDLNSYLRVCEACHRPINSVLPLAQEIGVNATILGQFLKGNKGVSIDTFNTLWTWLEKHRDEQGAVIPAMPEAEVATA